MQEFYVSSCQHFPRLSIFFTDWYLCLPFSRSEYFVLRHRQELKGSSCLHSRFYFFHRLVSCLRFSRSEYFFCYSICRNLLFLRIYFFFTPVHLFHGLLPCVPFFAVGKLRSHSIDRQLRFFMSNFFTPVYLFHANNISFRYTTDRNLRILHISLFHTCFTFSRIGTLFTFLQ